MSNPSKFIKLLEHSQEPPNSASNLPEVDTSSLETWGTTWAAKVIAYVNLHKKYGSVVLPQTVYNGSPHPEAGQEYDKGSFLADVDADLPWTGKAEKVERIASKVPGFSEALAYLNV